MLDERPGLEDVCAKRSCDRARVTRPHRANDLRVLLKRVGDAEVRAE
jgi:hypothetical protein